MKKIILILLVLSAFRLNAQYTPNLSVGYDPNFINVNKSNFSPSSGTVTYIDAQKYVSTILNLTTKVHTKLMSLNGLLSDPDLNNYATIPLIDATPAYKYDKIVRCNGLIARKTMFAKNYITGLPDKYSRMLVIRPDDNIVRPCIMITNGANIMFSLNLSGALYELMTDFALRGYTVVFYESLSKDLATVAALLPNNYPCNFTGSGSIDVEKNSYAGFQYAVSAYNYILADAALPISNRIINANTNDMHGLGISLGAVTTLMLGYSRNSINFTGYMKDFFQGTDCQTLISNNTFTKLCLNANPTTTINLKSVTAGNGGLPSNGGDYFTTVSGTPSKTIPTLLLYGRNDNIVPYDVQGSSGLPLISFDSIRRTLKLFNKPNKLIVNCTGDHTFTRNTPNNGILVFGSDANIILNNTQQINSTQYPGFIEFINNNDIQTVYQNFSIDGLCFRKFATQLSYDLIQRSNMSTILANFWKDVRTNNLGAYYNNNPFYVTTPLAYTCSPCLIFANRCAAANLDSHIEDSNTNPCPIPLIRIRSNTQFTRQAKPKSDEKEDIKDEFLIYPNPSNDYLTLKYASNSDKNIKIKIFNNLGEIILSENKKLELGENEIRISTINISNGMYLFTVENDNEIYTDKIIVNHY
jgi:hypothetical protein